MQVINYSTARQNLAATMDKTHDDCEPVFITRQNGRTVVMMSLEEYNSMMETFHLMKNPVVHARLLRSIEEVRSGTTQVHELIEVDDGEEQEESR